MPVISTAALAVWISMVKFAGAVVLKLDSSNINETLSGDPSHRPIFVKFFAPWCGHCRDMAASWVTLSEQQTDVRVGEVDCTIQESRPLMKRFGITGYPTLLLFTQDGEKIYKHTGPRSLAAISAFVSEDWKNAPEYDPTAQPPPSSRRRSFFGGYGIWFIFGLMGLSVCVGLVCLCVTLFDDRPAKLSDATRRKHAAAAAVSKRPVEAPVVDVGSSAPAAKPDKAETTLRQRTASVGGGGVAAAAVDSASPQADDEGSKTHNE
eukprot:TRINITY_DN50980_c0_g1_i1.p1 TRINITY_DN50980_c0_g1~~TRINITY_DN50980_c0_g1_i1.p1  ORF type:complete len:303 (-),score=43.95 TRINITY_DN50980_c0_g1_i1:103-894(-)